MPTQTHALTDLKVYHSSADGSDCSDDFVPGYEGVLCHPPLVIQHAEVTVTNAAVLNIDFDLLGTERTGVIFEGC
jgi:hypothetical protein